MIKSATALAVIAVANAAQVNVVAPEPSYEDWCAMFGKCAAFSDAESNTRRSVYADNVQYIEAHNAKFARGEVTFNMGVNEYSAMTHDEFKAYFNLGQKIPLRNATNVEILPEVRKIAGTQDSVDWRTKGAVTPVKNQGQCGSCWSFSSTGSMEGRIAIATGKIPGAPAGLSEQQLMDCSKSEGNNGCQGGLMDYAFKYVISNGGLDSEADYPYKMANGMCDKAKEADHVGVITGYKDVTPKSDSQFAAAVAQGPVSVAIEADQRAFQSYKSGILSAACGTKLDHGVLAVGYSDDYWIVKNSWGATWGMEGYVQLARGESSGPAGECGILSQPSYPVAGNPGPTPPTPPTPPSPPSPPGPSTGPYEDPNNGGCEADEQAVQITGVTGSFCSPKCTGVIFKKCPAAPSGTAKPQCVLETSGSNDPTQCALICDPTAEDKDGQCPGTATCKSVQTTGLCTYDN